MESCELARKFAPKMAEKITGNSPRNWTFEIKSALAEIGQESGFEVRFTDRQNKNKEFLWDVVWIDPGTGRLELAAESEMAKNQRVLEDFRRLLYAKAVMKLIVCDRGAVSENGREQGPQLLEQLKQALVSFHDHVAGEEYLVFDCYGNKNLRDGRQLHSYTWRAPANGSVGSGEVRWRQLCPPIPYTIRE